MKKALVSTCMLSIALCLSGCATIVGHPTQLTTINSTPSDAAILITDEDGVDVFKGSTPTTVTLQKKNGKYWGRKSYIVRISKDGFETQSVKITANANGWYIGGNIISGSISGWFVVDPFNGNMYNLSPEVINTSLLAKTAHNSKLSVDSISIMLIQDVPAELRSKMKRIN